MKSFGMILGAAIAAIIGFTTAHPTKNHTKGNEPPAYCVPLPQGYASDPGAPTTEAFNNFPQYSKLANDGAVGPIPGEYILNFLDVDGTVLYPEAYITHFDMKSYNIKECARACTAVHWHGCLGFNIYIERSPSKVPGPACPNPDPTYRYVCALYKDFVQPEDVKNNGSMLEQFHVLHRGSNGYARKMC